MATGSEFADRPKSDGRTTPAEASGQLDERASGAVSEPPVQPDPAARSANAGDGLGGSGGRDGSRKDGNGGEGKGKPPVPPGSLDWLKYVLTGGAVVGFLMAYGFLSETAAFQYLGLPQLQSDTMELVEQGGRNLVDSFGTLGYGLGLGLLGYFLLVLWLWWRRDRSPRLRELILNTRSLRYAQVAILVVLFLALASLVELRALTTTGGATITLAEREASVRAAHRQRPNWDPRQEFARLEAHDFEVGPVRWGCGWLESLVSPDHDWWSEAPPGPVAKFFDLHCFTARDYAAHPSRQGAGGDALFAGLDAEPVGIHKRRTAEARLAARGQFGLLFAALLALCLSAYLLTLWRAWLAARPLPAPADVTRDSVFDASRHLAEPLIWALLLACLGLLPGAYGVLASGKVGMQEVMVRLKNQGPSKDGPGCVGIESHGGAHRATVAGDEAYIATTDVLTCKRGELEDFERSITDYQRAWQDLYQVRVSEADKYQARTEALIDAADAVVSALQQSRCPEAFTRFWRVLPREAQFATRPEAAQYVWERWTELQRDRSLVRFGTLVTYPRGGNKDRLLLADLLALPSASQPIRVSLQPVPLACAQSVDPLPELERSAIRDVLTRIYASPTTAANLVVFERLPGEAALRAMQRLYRDAVIPLHLRGVLGTQIGTQAGMLRETHPLLHAEAVDLLAEELDCSLQASSTGRQVRGPDSPGADGATEGLQGDCQQEGRAPLARAAGLSTATALHLAGGEYAALRVARLLCQYMSGGSAEECRSLRRGAEAPGTVDAELSNEFGSLVTAAGFLAGDVQAGLRRHPLPPATHRGCEADEAAHTCPVISARNVLDAFAEAVAADRTSGDVRHNASNRRAACTALGLSGSPTAVHAIAALFQPLAAQRNELLLSTCLVHTPTVLNRSLREGLRQLARGQWPEPDKTGEGLPPTSKIRRVALIELYESGLYDEQELLLQLLQEPNSELRQLAAQLLGQAQPFAMASRLWDCAQRGLAPQGSSAADESDGRASALRCLLALPLVGEAEEGDGGLSRQLVLHITGASQTEAAFTSALCVAVEEFSARDGTDAREWLDTEEGKSACPMRILGVAKMPQESRRRVHLSRFEVSGLSGGSASNAQLDPELEEQTELAALDAMLAMTGDSEALKRLQERFRGASGEDRERAFVALSLAGFEHVAALSLPLLLEPTPTPLQFRAAQFIEDAEPLMISSELRGCVEDASRDTNLRARCAIGVALTRQDFLPGESITTALLDAVGAESLRAAACQALAELERRGARAAPAVCAEQVRSLGEAPRLRWNQHLRALLDALTAERRQHGPYANEDPATHEKLLQRFAIAAAQSDDELFRLR